ncbi:MAG: hypothetical protein ABC596_08805 [Candidatus Methanosuratincola petrocarbonis]
MSFLKSRKGQGELTGLVATGVLVVVFLAMMLPIGLGLSNSLLNSYDRSNWTAEMNNTVTNLQTQMTSSFDLFTIIPLVVAAGIVIAILFAVFKARE